MIRLNLSHLPPQLADMAKELLSLLGAQYSYTAGIVVVASIDSRHPQLVVNTSAGKLEITAPKAVHFARGLGIAAELYANDRLVQHVEEIRYPRLEIMADCARNAVLTVDALERLVRMMALMGYTGLQLYVEDVFEMEEYPYFGYMRGAYSKQELQAVEATCERFGIELIPCIQTLAHLGRALRWGCFEEITDFDDILLVDEPKSYELIEAMIRTMSDTLKSRSINLGMDEAHMLGLGKYLDQHGYQNRVDIMLRHFNKVQEIADRYGYHSMMWSDMFFRLFNHGRYENTVVQSDEAYATLRSQIPQDIKLVYWNYYSEDKAVYDNLLTSHMQMSDNIAFAAGAWRWTAPSPYNTYSLHVSPPAHASCLEHGIQHIIVTSWGDDGGETSIFAVLPSFQYWAEACYQGEVTEPQLQQRFATCTGGSWTDFLLLDEVLLTPENPRFALCGSSPCKYFLYQDILCGLFDRHVSALDKPHFEQTAVALTQAAARSGHWAVLFEVQAALATLLAHKVNLGVELRQAYRTGQRAELQQYVEQRLPMLLTYIDTFAEVYSTQWLQENKVFGLDMFDIRIGGLKERVRRAIQRIRQYLEGQLATIPELEQDILYYDCRSENDSSLPLAVREYYWSNMATASSSRNSKSY